jgi:hypothetical protein
VSPFPRHAGSCSAPSLSLPSAAVYDSTSTDPEQNLLPRHRADLLLRRQLHLPRLTDTTHRVSSKTGLTPSREVLALTLPVANTPFSLPSRTPSCSRLPTSSASSYKASAAAWRARRTTTRGSKTACTSWPLASSHSVSRPSMNSHRHRSL